MSDMTELFARDPLGLSEQDIGIIVKRLREHQAQFELGAPKVPAPKPPKSNKTQQLLKDLGLA